MAPKYVSVDISKMPDLKRLAEAVRKSGTPYALKEGAETIAIVRPASTERRRTSSARGGGRRFTMDDPLFSIVGIAPGTGPENVSGNVDRYLAEACLDEQQ